MADRKLTIQGWIDAIRKEVTDESNAQIAVKELTRMRDEELYRKIVRACEPHEKVMFSDLFLWSNTETGDPKFWVRIGRIVQK